MLRLTTLGDLSLKGDDGRILSRRTKELTLLAYLARKGPKPVRRLELALIFWGNDDDARAHHSLRQALVNLRRDAGDILKADKDVVGLDASAIHVDANEMEKAAREGKTRYAAALYGGEFLPGAEDAGREGFRFWLEAEREKLRKLAASLVPVEPPPDLEAIVRVVADDSRATTTAKAEDAGRQALFTLRHRRFAAAAGIVVVLVAVGASMNAMASHPRVSMSHVAVFPFSATWAKEHAFLGGGIADLLSTTLDGAADLSTVDPRSLAAAAERHGDVVRPADALAIAERFGAGSYVLDSILEVEGRLRVSAALYQRTKGEEPVARASVAGTSDQVFELVDQLTELLLASWRAGPGGSLLRRAAQSTHSLAAFKAYLEGERSMRLWNYAPALEAYQRATAEDSTFALAHYQTAVAALFASRFPVARAAVEEAVRRRDQLSDREKGMLDALYPFVMGQTEMAERAYEAHLALYPDNVAAWYELGELRFHTNAMRGVPIATAGAAFERALKYDPHYEGALVHLIEIAAHQRQRARFDSLMTTLESSSPKSEWLIMLRTLRAFMWEGRAEQDRMVAEARALASPIGVALESAGYVALHAERPDRAERLLAIMTDPKESDNVRARGLYRFAHFELAQGRVSEAERYLAELDRFEHGWALEHLAQFRLLPFVPTTRAALEDARARLAAWDADRAPRSTNAAFSPADSLHPVIRTYLMGAIDARLGNTPSAERCATLLDSTHVSQNARALAGALARVVRAEVHMQKGRHAEALRVLESAPLDVDYSQRVRTSFLTRAYERYLRADLLMKLGRNREALAWFATQFEFTYHGTPYMAPAHLRRAELFLRFGQTDSARRSLASAARLWANADAAVRPLLSQTAASIGVAR